MKPYFETESGKLYHGDCLEIIPQLEAVDFIYTDPPYNAKKHYGPYRDNMPDDKYLSYMSEIYRALMILSDKMITHIPKKYLTKFLGFFDKGTLIFVKRGAIGYLNGQHFTDQGDILFARGQPIKTSPTLWEGIRLKGEGYFFREEIYGHFGYTPLPIASRAIQDMTTRGQVVFDCFGGTGTTFVSAEKYKRRWVGCEYEEKFCEIAAKRITRETQQRQMFR